MEIGHIDLSQLKPYLQRQARLSKRAIRAAPRVQRLKGMTYSKERIDEEEDKGNCPFQDRPKEKRAQDRNSSGGGSRSSASSEANEV